MADAMESDQDEDLDMTDANGNARETVSKSDTVQYGELNISSAQDTIAAGVAAGNIHLQTSDAATLALPEARLTSMTAVRPVDGVAHNLMTAGQQRSKSTARAPAASCRGEASTARDQCANK